MRNNCSVSLKDSCRRLAVFLLTFVCLSAFIYPASAFSETRSSLDEFNSLADTSYEYQRLMTREEFCIAVARLFNGGRKAETSPLFEDIDEIKPENLPYLSALVEDGLLRGVGVDGRVYMRPNEPISRQEAVTFLGRVLGQTSDSALSFTDEESIALFAYAHIAWFVDWGIILGYPDGSFRPGHNMNAGELASLSIRTLDFQKIAVNRIETLAGTGGPGLSDGGRLDARFTLPNGIIGGPGGTVIVFDTYNNAVRHVTSRGTQTLAGKVEFYDEYGFPQGFYLDEALDKALMNRPSGGVIDSAGNLFIADSANHAIRHVRDGRMYTFSGTVQGFADGARDAARFNTPIAIAIDRNDNIYVADTLNNCIRRIGRDGRVSTIAGVPGVEGYLDGETQAALFRAPSGIAVSSDGNVIFVADTGNHLIRKIENGQVTTFAGRIGELYDGEPMGGFQNGLALSSRFSLPRGIALANGTIYIADSGNHMIRAITPTGNVITVAGNGEAGDRDGAVYGAALNAPGGVCFMDGAIYIADTGNNKIKTISFDNGNP